MSRARTALTHLWPSLLAAGIILVLVAFAWYPGPFLQFQGNTKFSLLLVGFAALAGPVLTWLVYKEHRFKFRFDVSVIVLIQLAALGWGSWTLLGQRPYFMVFSVDRFEVLAKKDVNPADIADPRFLEKPFTGAVLLFAAMPTDRQVYSELVREVVLEGRPDLHLRPGFWHLYTEKQQVVVQIARPLAELRTARPGSVAKIDRWVQEHGGDIARFRFVPAWGRFGEFAAVLDAANGDYLGGIVTSPWLD